MRRLVLNLRAGEAPTRREALAGLAASLAAGCAPVVSDDVRGDSDGGVEPATIDHVIVVMMENRSFDHFLGGMKLEEGRTDLDGLEATMSNAGSDGTVYTVRPAEVGCLADPPHGWGSAHDQFNDGANDGFVTEYEGAPSLGEVMAYMTRADLPITWALADAYTVCDRYFCSVMGPTWPNRLYGHAGTSDGSRDNSLPDSGGGFAFPTVWHKLTEVGVAWKYYYTDLPFLGLFNGLLSENPGGFLDEFVADAQAGRLPPVCWVDPGFSFCDDHPPHHVALGQEFLRTVYEALATSPHWNRCLLLITYDEHGGFFDHVPPPTTEDDFASTGFDQLGFRVPSLVVGPFVKPGTSSVVFDHTSWIKFVCDRFGIEPWTARIAAATSLGEVLDADRMAVDDPLPAAAVPAFDYDDDSLGSECFGGGLGPSTAPPDHQGTADEVAESGQPELEAFVRAHLPALDATRGARERFARLVGRRG